ncbi:hypothetical protein [Actinophytocola sp.]|uniref:hypothetical protein n=1 Tax=Actinophytocola sp. TaxID=1872138 RepID=UPI002D6E43E3|nr:hypothetical protein [Actinophytocola sp.]HYQ65940.1 hypothetical protein [Actinophytocola sp.]
MFETTISLDALAESLALTGLPVEVLLPEADGELVGHINILQASREDRSITLHPQGLGPLLCELMRKDTSKQPTFIDRRLPTFDELKQRPGFARYMESGTYDEAIADWAKGICASAIPEDDAFCSVAKSYGLLEKGSWRGEVHCVRPSPAVSPIPQPPKGLPSWGDWCRRRR